MLKNLDKWMTYRKKAIENGQCYETKSVSFCKMVVGRFTVYSAKPTFSNIGKYGFNSLVLVEGCKPLPINGNVGLHLFLNTILDKDLDLSSEIDKINAIIDTMPMYDYTEFLNKVESETYE